MLACALFVCWCIWAHQPREVTNDPGERSAMAPRDTPLAVGAPAGHPPPDYNCSWSPGLIRLATAIARSAAADAA